MSLAAFLQDRRNKRTLCAYAEAYREGVGLVEHTWSNTGFITKPADGEQVVYAPVIIGEPVFAASIDSDLSISSLQLSNAGGVLDEALGDDFAQRLLRLSVGPENWALSLFASANFACGASGLTGNGYDELSIDIADASAALDQPISSETTANGHQVPVGVGTCFNVEPVFLGEDIDGAHYQLNFGDVSAVTAYRSGCLAIDPVRITEDLGNGKFTIDPPPSGDVRCDVVFQSASGVVDNVRYLLQLSGVSFNATNLNTWAATTNPVSGVFFSTKKSYRAAIDELAGSIGLRLSGFASGGLSLYRIAPPQTSPVMAFGVGNIVDGSFVFNRLLPPYAAARLGYRRNHAPQDKNSMYETVGLADVDAYSREFQTVTALDTGNDENYPGAVRIPDGDITPSALYEQADAASEVNRRMSLFATPVLEFSFSADEDFFFMLGSVITITYPRYGFDAGVDVVVTGIRWYPVSKRCELTFWVWA